MFVRNQKYVREIYNVYVELYQKLICEFFKFGASFSPLLPPLSFGGTSCFEKSVFDFIM